MSLLPDDDVEWESLSRDDYAGRERKQFREDEIGEKEKTRTMSLPTKGKIVVGEYKKGQELAINPRVMANAGGEREQFREGKTGKEEKTHKMSLLTDDSDVVERWGLLTDDYDGVHIIVMGDSEEAIKQLICLFTQTSLRTQEEPVVDVDRKRVRYARKVLVQQWQVRQKRRSIFLYQLPAGCDPHTILLYSLVHYKPTLEKYRFLPILWWVVCESLHHALSYMVKGNNKSLLDEWNLPIVLLNCIMSAEKRCQHIKVVGCIRLADLAIIDIGAHFLRMQTSASICRLSEKYLFNVSEHERVSSENWDGDKGGQLFTIAMQAQGLSQLLQQSKNLMIEDGLNCAWGSWCLPSIYRMLHLSAKLVDMILEESFFSFVLIPELHLIWHFPFKNDMEFDDEQFLDDDPKYLNNIVIGAGYFVGLIIWMKWSHITKSLEAYINTYVQRPWMETSKISEKHPLRVDEDKEFYFTFKGDMVKECQNFRRSSFGIKVNEFFQGFKTMQKSVTSDEIEKFYHSLLLDGDLDCNNDEKIFQHISPHDDLHKELENIFKDMAVISVNQVVCRANADTVIARKNSTRRDDLELVFHTGKAMSSCVGVGLDHSIVEVGKEVLIQQKKQSLWEETLGQVANREEEYVIVQVSRKDFACSCIRTFTQETNTSEKHGVSLGEVTSYYEMQSTPNCPHGHAPLLHLLSKFVLDVLKGKQSLHKVSEYGEKPLMLFDFAKLREELDAGRVAQSTAKDLISGVVVVSGDAGGSSVNSEFGGVGTSKGTSSNDGNGDQDGTGSVHEDDKDKQDGMNNGSENNGNNDGNDNGNPDNEGCLKDKSNDKLEYEVTINLDSDGCFEPANPPPPKNIKGQTITPKITVKFCLEGKCRRITITASTTFSQNAKPEGGYFVWYHDDISLAVKALKDTVNEKCQARLEGAGEILNAKTAREFTFKNSASTAVASTKSGAIQGQAQLGIAKAEVKVSGSSNSQESASQGCDVKSFGSFEVCDGFNARSQSDGHALRYRLAFYHPENPRDREWLVKTTGLFRTIEPEIQGAWIPQPGDRREHACYCFKACRAWKKLGVVEHSDPAAKKFEQRYKILLFVNHAFSHMQVPVDDEQWGKAGQIWPAKTAIRH